MESRKKGISVDNEEYIEGVRGVAVPLRVKRMNTQSAIWAVGLKSQIKARDLTKLANYLKRIADEIEVRLLG